MTYTHQPTIVYVTQPTLTFHPPSLLSHTLSFPTLSFHILTSSQSSPQPPLSHTPPYSDESLLDGDALLWWGDGDEETRDREEEEVLGETHQTHLTHQNKLTHLSLPNHMVHLDSLPTHPSNLSSYGNPLIYHININYYQNNL